MHSDDAESWCDRSDRHRTRPRKTVALQVSYRPIGPRCADIHDGQTWSTSRHSDVVQVTTGRIYDCIRIRRTGNVRCY